MKFYRIGQLFGSLCVMYLLVFNAVMADPVKWDTLSKMEKHVIKEHKTKWDDYSESRQDTILKAAKPIVKRMKHYKQWVQKLPNKERLELEKKFKEMSPKAFKKYVDKLMKKSAKDKDKDKE